MKRLRILGLALLALFALGAVMAGVALGEEGVLEPQNFTIKGGTQILENLNKEVLSCTSVEGQGIPLPKGEKDHDTQSTGTLDFKGCKSGGFPVNTLGDENEVILAKVLYLLCLHNATELKWDVLVLPTGTAYLEVPAVKILILVKGAIIGLLLTALKGNPLEGNPEVAKIGVIFVKEDVPTAARKKCSLKELGEWTANYEAAADTKADVDAWQVGEADITFAAATLLMDK
jgi:hypothetical protein